MKAALVLSLLPVLAFAEPRIETIDRGDAVEIVAHGVTAANTTLVPVRTRLEIAVANKPAPFNAPSPDKTIVISELDGKTLSIKTAFDRSDMKNLAPHAKAIQIGADLHILIPRKIPSAGATIELPEPTMGEVPKVVKVEMPEAAKPEPEAKTEAKPEAKTEAKTEAKPEADAAEPKVEAKTDEPKTEEPKAAAVEAKPAKTETSALGTKKEESGPMGKAGMLATMAMVAIGCGFWLLKKRKKEKGVESSIEVLASHAIGAKAKVVWISAGGREMLLAVTPQGVRTLGQWEKSAHADAEERFEQYTENRTRTRLPTAQLVAPPTMPDGRAGRAETVQIERKRAATVDPSSPAVAGLLKLRAQTARPQPQAERIEAHRYDSVNEELDDDVKTDDVEADALWAKEIIAATRATNTRAATVRANTRRA